MFVSWCHSDKKKARWVDLLFFELCSQQPPSSIPSGTAVITWAFSVCLIAATQLMHSPVHNNANNSTFIVLREAGKNAFRSQLLFILAKVTLTQAFLNHSNLMAVIYITACCNKFLFNLLITSTYIWTNIWLKKLYRGFAFILHIPPTYCWIKMSTQYLVNNHLYLIKIGNLWNVYLLLDNFYPCECGWFRKIILFFFCLYLLGIKIQDANI